MSGEGFAARWARLKGAAPLSEEVAPDLESVALEDIAGWLKRNVPQAWKSAALRRLWVADPAIREFVGLADYAWDWNAPGGTEMLGALDDMAELVMRAMGTEKVAEVAEVAAPSVAVAEAEKVVAAPLPAVREVADARRRGGRAAPV